MSQTEAESPFTTFHVRCSEKRPRARTSDEAGVNQEAHFINETIAKEHIVERAAAVHANHLQTIPGGKQFERS